MPKPVAATLGTLLAIGFMSALFGMFGTGIVLILGLGFAFKGGFAAHQKREVYRQMASEEFDLIADEVDNRFPGGKFVEQAYGTGIPSANTNADFLDFLIGVDQD